MRIIKGFIMSLGMFSIIPVPKSSWDDKYASLVTPALPPVGLLIGVLWYGLSFPLSISNVPLIIKSVVILFIPFFLSGFIHLDGYMDTADAVFSRRSTDEKKRILKDPHTGAFAVIALVGLILFQFCAVYSIIDAQKGLLIFVLIPVVSRGLAGISALRLKPLFETGYVASFKSGAKTGHTVFICVLVALCCASAWLTLGITALPLLAGIAAGIIAVCYLYRQFHGISGDLSGCIITVSEFAALLCMSLL